MPWIWGATPAEDAARYPCDELAGSGDLRLLRAVSVAAPAETVWAWLGNLRVAPYSYDWLDNLGRRSPRALRTGLPPLQPGQRIMTIFTAEHVAPGSDLSIYLHDGPGLRLFGQVRVTYAVRPEGEGSRLIAVLRLAAGGGALSSARRLGLAWGDLLMMRKQLYTLRDLAEGRHDRP
ncbi:hypothetical protein GCM10009751_25590 [Myceligenerans crystallogenes]|uniref:Polyketide cyclase / dehydrase and lipid transport n=2 Tax=Myceligenerans crystallogenes TaxID=316335 RepID=A0ABN2NG18_9MICO